MNKEKMIEHAKKYSYFIKNKLKEEIQPIALILNKDNALDIASSLSFANVRHKDAFASFLKDQVANHGAKAIAFICEAWMVSFKNLPEYEEYEESNKQVSDLPGKVEVVLISYNSFNDSTTYTAEIKNDVLTNNWKENVGREGRFADLFRQVQRDLAINN